MQSEPRDPEAPPWLGRYELVRTLGRGASGRVMEAVLHGPRGFRKRVALKLLHPRAALDGDEVTQFAHEARFGALLSHPNVVSTFELGQVDGVWFVAMELVKGKSLSQLLRSGPLPPAALLDVGIQVCAALSHVHELVEDGRPLRLVHRDVKPGNLLVDTTGVVRLADFGVAGIAAEGGGRTSGTPGFMAPEQIDGRAEPRSDLFALGMTLLSCAAGSNPFGRGREAIDATLDVERALATPELLHIAEHVVPGLGGVLYAALRRDPEHRWPDARAMAQALRSLRSAAAGASLAELAIEGPAPASEPVAPVTVATLHRRDPPLVGRTGALGRLREAIARPGIVTLVGPGGVGKTRLVAELVQGGVTAGGGPTEYVWCDLVSCRSLTELCVSVATSLGTDLREGDPAEQIGRAIGARGRVALVLDNLEQVLDVAAPAIARWATLAPAAALVCTSRAPLRVTGEELLEVEPLEPSDAEALFSAIRGRPVEASERAAVRELIRRVDGLPLAIELVAVRSKVVPVGTLFERFDDRLRLTAAGPRTADPRHRTLQATIQWSWELLGAPERRALTQLSVLEGPFPLEVAEALCARDSDHPTLDLLTTVVEHHLLRVRGDRFEWLDLVRAYARRELESAGLVDAAERRHGEHFASWGSNAARRALRRPGGAARLRALCEVQPELVAACRRAVRRADPAVAVPAVLAAAEAIVLVGPAPSGVALCDEVLDLALKPLERGLVQERRGELLEIVGQRDDALEAYEDASRWFTLTADPSRAMRISIRIGGLLRIAGRFDEARARLDRGLAEARASGQRFCEALALNHLGLLLRDQGDPEEALRQLTLALAVHRAA
ncbi:MAG: protein kinase, partial [Myxococcota bacterium]